MSHEIDNSLGKPAMMYVGDAPWHNLGTKVEAGITTEQAILAAGLNWQVGLKDLFTADQEKVPALATYRQDTNAILGVVGPGYKPLQNADAFKFFNTFLENKAASLETAGALRGGQRVWILAKIASAPVKIVGDDVVEKYVLLSNSHDGTMAVRVGFTPIRVVCNNTLTFAHNDKASQLLRVKHVGNVATTLEKIKEVMNLADQQFEATAEQYRLLAKMNVNEADLRKYVSIVFATKEESENAGAKVFGKIQELFESGRGNALPGVKGTMWAGYNAITEYLQYGRGKTEESRLDNMWFGSAVSINKKALDAAVMMAKIAA